LNCNRLGGRGARAGPSGCAGSSGRIDAGPPARRPAVNRRPAPYDMTAGRRAGRNPWPPTTDSNVQADQQATRCFATRCPNTRGDDANVVEATGQRRTGSARPLLPLSGVPPVVPKYVWRTQAAASDSYNGACLLRITDRPRRCSQAAGDLSRAGIASGSACRP
jgi:hypothetical protein